jgi:hypothetical protein
MFTDHINWNANFETFREVRLQQMDKMAAPLGFRCDGFAWFRWLHLGKSAEG